jgi:hypothetical protein
MANHLMIEFMAWARRVDEEACLDVFDLALGFYAGRHPERPHHLACAFADRARKECHGRSNH